MEPMSSKPMARRRAHNADTSPQGTPVERMNALAKQLGDFHFSHNEVRRLTPVLLSTMVEVLNELVAKPTKKDPK